MLRITSGLGSTTHVAAGFPWEKVTQISQANNSYWSKVCKVLQQHKHNSSRPIPSSRAVICNWVTTYSEGREDVAQVRCVQWLLEVVVQLGWKPSQQCDRHYTTAVSVWCLAHLRCKHNMKAGCMMTLPEAIVGCPCRSCDSQCCWTDTQWSPALKTAITIPYFT